MATPAEAAARLLDFALALPGAVEDHPWGGRVVRVAKKIFVSLGSMEDGKQTLDLTVKLPRSAGDALNQPYAQMTGYGLGPHDWVTLRFGAKSKPPLARLLAWTEESYRAVAPKRLVKELDARPRA